jgi:hypothetical protein
MHTQSVQAAEWWARPRGVQAQSWVQNYQRSLGARHRQLISQLVGELKAETVFEVGCHCGPNLIRICRDHPTVHAHGIDASAEAVVAGRGWVAQLGLADRVQVTAQRFPEGTAATPSGFADVVLSCYTLAYVAPADLDAALYEMGRIAARAVVLAEPMPIEGPIAHVHRMNGYSEWAHDYQAALAWIGNLRGVKTRLVPVRPAVDRLNAILVVERADPPTLNSQ